MIILSGFKVKESDNIRLYVYDLLIFHSNIHVYNILNIKIIRSEKEISLDQFHYIKKI